MMPIGFDGIFYDFESSLGLVNEKSYPQMIAQILLRPEAFFLFAGGVLDLRLYGYTALADVFETAAKAAYPQGPWGELEAFKARVDQAVILGGEHLSRLCQTLYADVLKAFVTPGSFVPEGFQSVFFTDTKGYGLVFLDPQAVAEVAAGMEDGYRRVVVIAVELYMNGYISQADALIAACEVRFSYPSQSVRDVGRQARELLLARHPGWESEVTQLVFSRFPS